MGITIKEDTGPNIAMVKSETGLQLAFAKFALWANSKDIKEFKVVYETINSYIMVGSCYTIFRIGKNGTSKVVLYMDKSKVVHVSSKYKDLFYKVFKSNSNIQF